MTAELTGRFLRLTNDAEPGETVLVEQRHHRYVVSGRIWGVRQPVGEDTIRMNIQFGLWVRDIPREWKVPEGL